MVFACSCKKTYGGGERFSDLKSVRPLKNYFLVLFTQTLILLCFLVQDFGGFCDTFGSA